MGGHDEVRVFRPVREGPRGTVRIVLSLVVVLGLVGVLVVAGGASPTVVLVLYVVVGIVAGAVSVPTWTRRRRDLLRISVGSVDLVRAGEVVTSIDRHDDGFGVRIVVRHLPGSPSVQRTLEIVDRRGRISAPDGVWDRGTMVEVARHLGADEHDVS